MKDPKNTNSPESSDVPRVVDLSTRFASWFPKLSVETRSRLILIYDELLKANKTLSLITPAAMKHFESSYIAEVVLAAELIEPKLVGSAPVVDASFSSLAGGLIFAVLWPNREFLVLEKDVRRRRLYEALFLQLGVKRVRVEGAGIEDLDSGSVMNLISRGALPFQKSLMSARKPVGAGGRYFQLKNDGWANELASVQSQLFTYWSPGLLGQSRLPDSSQTLAVIVSDKLRD